MSKSHKKFYKDFDFIDSSEARPTRILSEYFGPMRIFKQMKIKDTLVFFGSARIPSPEEARRWKEEKLSEEQKGLLSLAHYYEEARQLAFRMTQWSKGLKNTKHRFIVTSGGGGGIMEAACRGAREAGGYSMGLNISLPQEQKPNPYITPELDMEFHYFFMRKFWFLYLAKALIIFPGGFGTIDELVELLTLLQTEKIKKKVPVVIYGQEYWKKIIDFEELVRGGTISGKDLKFIHFSNIVEEAFQFLTQELTKAHLRGANF